MVSIVAEVVAAAAAEAPVEVAAVAAPAPGAAWLWQGRRVASFESYPNTSRNLAHLRPARDLPVEKRRINSLRKCL